MGQWQLSRTPTTHEILQPHVRPRRLLYVIFSCPCVVLVILCVRETFAVACTFATDIFLHFSPDASFIDNSIVDHRALHGGYDSTVTHHGVVGALNWGRAANAWHLGKKCPVLVQNISVILGSSTLKEYCNRKSGKGERLRVL